MDDWPRTITLENPEVMIERVTINNASKLAPLEGDPSAYSFQIVQIPLRSVLSEGMFFSLSLADEDGYRRVFAEACTQIDRNIDALLTHNRDHGLCTFLLNFMTPQQNPMGRLQSRYSLSNLVFFVEELNRHLDERVRAKTNVYLIDIDQIAGNFGKKYIQDDSVSHSNHGSLLHGIALPGDENRLEPIGEVKDLYRPEASKFILSVWNEAVAAYRSIQQVDSIKLVIFDLDDTLWRGVPAEADDVDPMILEGWPLGILEAASNLWRRGILLAIVSKNDEAKARAIWSRYSEQRFSLDKFAALKINWRPKVENIAEILAAVNLLPQNVLFVDDNPVERAAVRERFPGILVLDAPLAEWRRILLWAPEGQPAVVTSEAVNRTSMVQAQIHREVARSEVSEEEFLKSLDVSIKGQAITEETSPIFTRCFELINKTNQFNTTGRRWTHAELVDILKSGGFLLALDVKDRYTGYGITCVAIVLDDVLEQVVMSCRVFGLGVERTCLSLVIREIKKKGFAKIKGRLNDTGKNALSLRYFEDAGFWLLKSENVWIAPVTGVSIPEHVSVENVTAEPVS